MDGEELGLIEDSSGDSAGSGVAEEETSVEETPGGEEETESERPGEGEGEQETQEGDRRPATEIGRAHV